MSTEGNFHKNAIKPEPAGGVRGGGCTRAGLFEQESSPDTAGARAGQQLWGLAWLAGQGAGVYLASLNSTKCQGMQKALFALLKCSCVCSHNLRFDLLISGAVMNKYEGEREFITGESFSTLSFFTLQMTTAE